MQCVRKKAQDVFKGSPEAHRTSTTADASTKSGWFSKVPRWRKEKTATNKMEHSGLSGWFGKLRGGRDTGRPRTKATDADETESGIPRVPDFWTQASNFDAKSHLKARRHDNASRCRRALRYFGDSKSSQAASEILTQATEPLSAKEGLAYKTDWTNVDREHLGKIDGNVALLMADEEAGGRGSGVRDQVSEIAHWNGMKRNQETRLADTLLPNKGVSRYA